MPELTASMNRVAEQRIADMMSQLDEFRVAAKSEKMTDKVADEFARHAAASVMAYFAETGNDLAPAVRLLCEMSVSRHAHIRNAGIAGLFSSLIEPLNDSFDGAQVTLYEKLFADVLEFCRRLPDAAITDSLLHRFGLHSAADILRRRQQLPLNNERNAIHLRDNHRFRKFLLPSRVTIGADVAVTSVILSALRQSFPQAECVLLGSAKLREIFGRDEKLRVREINYQRSGSLAQRIDSWAEIVAAVEEETTGFNLKETAVIDPDSRLTQLGLLPLLKDESRYYFFESRRSASSVHQRLGQLTAGWINALLGTHLELFPQLALPAKFSEMGEKLAKALRQSGAQHIVCISFGVGGNPRKRLPDVFEKKLLCALADDATLLIDKGFTPDEQQQVSQLLTTLREQGKVIAELSESRADELMAAEKLSADVVTWQGGIGSFAGLIAASDEYVGYDSAGQHIAAALGTPTLTIFVNSGSPRFAERWHPHGRGRIHVINVAPENAGSEMKNILEQAITIHQQISNSG
jgi:ADP-heptose:LPS heptosyltransferase